MANRGRYYHSGISFIFLLIIYIINIFLLKDNFDICRNYLNDLLAMPLLLCYSDILFSYKNKQMPMYFEWFLFITCAIIWEGIMPLLYNFSTADTFDIFAYFFGTLIWVYWKTFKYKNQELIE